MSSEQEPQNFNVHQTSEIGAIEAVASAFHEDWRSTRLRDDLTYEPRIKTTTDEAWVAAHGTDQVDIANTSFAELPSDWQEENVAAATVVVRLLGRGGIDLSDDTQRTAAGTEIHDAWLARNAWAQGGELDVPFTDLSATEQAKDIDQLTVAQLILAREVGF